MNRITPVVIITALAALGLVVLASKSTPATAATQSLHQSFTNNAGEYLYIESRDTGDSNKAFPAVVAAVEKAGYTRNPPSNGRLPQQFNSDTWCKVDVYTARQILSECYTPQMGHSVAVRNHLVWTEQEFKGDYSGLPTMIAQIRDEHRRASAALDIK